MLCFLDVDFRFVVPFVIVIGLFYALIAISRHSAKNFWRDYGRPDEEVIIDEISIMIGSVYLGDDINDPENKILGFLKTYNEQEKIAVLEDTQGILFKVPISSLKKQHPANNNI